MQWFPFYGSDFLGATIGLSHAERGTYALMLVAYYETEKPFPKERSKVYRIVHCESDEQKRSVDMLLREFFVEQDDGFYNERAEQEIAKWRVIQAKKSAAGVKSGEARRRAATGSDPESHASEQVFNARSTPVGTPVGTPVQQLLNKLVEPPTPTVKETPPTPSQLSPSKASCGPNGPPVSAVPFGEIVGLYNRLMVNLPKVRDVTDKRRRQMRTWWNADRKRQSLDFVRAYFEECADDPFLNGTGPYRGGHESWSPNFDYLMRTDLVTQVFEKAQHRLERRAA